MHQSPVVEYRSPGATSLTVVLVHGRTLTPDYMRALAERIDLPNVRYVMPAADGNTWYPKSFLAPFSENEPSLSAAIARYEAIVTQLLAEGVAPGRLLVGGFSQGACLSAEYLYRHPRRLGGALLWTGGLIGEDTDWQPRRELNGMPVYITTSQVDPFVPAARVMKTVEWLAASGASTTVRVFPERAHEVSDEEIAGARTLFRAALV
jgi:predicted esterase